MEGKCESNAEICIAHKGLYLGEKPFPNAPDSGNVLSFVDNMHENCKLLIAGDYHKPFICKGNDCVVVNCGSVFRMRADQIDYKPQLWLCEWSSSRNEYVVKGVPIPLKYPIRRDYIDTKHDEEEKLEELVGGISGDFEITANFKDNFKNMIKDLPNKELVYELFERCDK
jgi:DNA repair exonuclease SbcCD nuclease subunit